MTKNMKKRLKKKLKKGEERKAESDKDHGSLVTSPAKECDVTKNSDDVGNLSAEVIFTARPAMLARSWGS